jgi:hypothetical protein
VLTWFFTEQAKTRLNKLKIHRQGEGHKEIQKVSELTEFGIAW